LLSSAAGAYEPPAAEPNQKSLALDELAAGDVVEITTAAARYRFEIVDAATGETLGQAAYGSDPYSAARRVYLLGATHGREAQAAGMMLVQMHRVRVGMKLELGVRSLRESDRRFTAPIETIRVTPATRDQVALLAQ
jgi:hypothetical protein